MYYFKWRSPVRDGKLKAMHCMEIPFVFDIPDAGKPMTGSGEDRYALASKISGAWVDDKCEVVDDPRKEVRQALASLPA